MTSKYPAIHMIRGEKLVKLDDIFNIQAGYLKTRIKSGINSKPIEIYSKQHFDYDHNYENGSYEFEASYIELDKDKYFTLKEGDIIVDSLSLKAAVVSKKHGGMFIAFNYFVLKPKENAQVDLDSFVAFFNLNDHVRTQLDKVLHGSVIKKLTLKQLKDIELISKVINNKQIGILYKAAQRKLNYANKIHNNELDIIRHAMEVIEHNVH